MTDENASIFTIPKGFMPKFRPDRDEWFTEMAILVSRRSTCRRLAVGAVLVSERGHVLATGYNGRAAGLPHCAEGIGGVFPHACFNSDAPPGEPNGCESIHAEQNALLQCRDVHEIETCYCTIAPCLTCVKLLLNTSCRRIVFAEEYAYPDAVRLWTTAGRSWERLRR